jgi:hypothetical protein
MKLKSTVIALKSDEYAFEYADDWSTADKLYFMSWVKEVGLEGKVTFNSVDMSMFAEEFLVPVIVIPKDKQLLTLFRLKWS